MSTIMISDIMERNIINMCSEYVGIVIRQLGTKYSFDAEQALRELDVPTIKKSNSLNEKKQKKTIEKKKNEPRIVPSIPLPFCGVINDQWCQAIVKNHKLYTQCTNIKEDSTDYCKKCNKICEKDGALPFGNISSRMEGDHMLFKDPKGNAVAHYAIVMKKLNITQENATLEAAKFGWVIDQNQFTIPEKNRGRPKKSDDEASSEDADKKNAKRGRPKKDKPLKASSQAGDNIIAQLMAEAKANAKNDDEEEEHATPVTPPPVVDTKKQLKEKEKAEKAAAKEAAKAAKDAEKAAKEAEKAAAKAAKEAEKNTKKNKKEKVAEKVAEKVVEKVAETVPETVAEKNDKELSSDEISSDEEQDDDVPEIKVKKFEFKGKIYLKSDPDNILYDSKTQEAIGVFNPKTNTIDSLPSEDEEDEDDEE